MSENQVRDLISKICHALWSNPEKLRKQLYYIHVAMGIRTPVSEWKASKLRHLLAYNLKKPNLNDEEDWSRNINFVPKTMEDFDLDPEKILHRKIWDKLVDPSQKPWNSSAIVDNLLLQCTEDKTTDVPVIVIDEEEEQKLEPKEAISEVITIIDDIEDTEEKELEEAPEPPEEIPVIVLDEEEGEKAASKEEISEVSTEPPDLYPMIDIDDTEEKEREEKRPELAYCPICQQTEIPSIIYEELFKDFARYRRYYPDLSPTDLVKSYKAHIEEYKASYIREFKTMAPGLSPDQREEIIDQWQDDPARIEIRQLIKKVPGMQARAIIEEWASNPGSRDEQLITICGDSTRHFGHRTCFVGVSNRRFAQENRGWVGLPNIASVLPELLPNFECPLCSKDVSEVIDTKTQEQLNLPRNFYQTVPVENGMYGPYRLKTRAIVFYYYHSIIGGGSYSGSMGEIIKVHRFNGRMDQIVFDIRRLLPFGLAGNNHTDIDRNVTVARVFDIYFLAGLGIPTRADVSDIYARIPCPPESDKKKCYAEPLLTLNLSSFQLFRLTMQTFEKDVRETKLPTYQTALILETLDNVTNRGKFDEILEKIRYHRMNTLSGLYGRGQLPVPSINAEELLVQYILPKLGIGRGHPLPQQLFDMTQFTPYLRKVIAHAIRSAIIAASPRSKVQMSYPSINVVLSFLLVGYQPAKDYITDDIIEALQSLVRETNELRANQDDEELKVRFMQSFGNMTLDQAEQFISITGIGNENYQWNFTPMIYNPIPSFPHFRREMSETEEWLENLRQIRHFRPEIEDVEERPRQRRRRE